MPLSTMVGITNIGSTFPLAYVYITSELASSFDFIAYQLIKYVFYDIPEPAVIVADFTKGLGASIAANARQQAQTPPSLAFGPFAKAANILIDDKVIIL